MPSPAAPIIVVAISLLLVALGIALVLLAARPTDRVLSSVALANTSIAFVLAFWMLAGWSRFSIGGRLVVALTVTGFLALAVGELLGTLEDKEASTPART